MPTTPVNSTCVRSRSDTTANWTAANPILLQGEWAHDVTTGCVRIGNGVSRWADLCDFCPDCGSPPPPPPPTGACCFGTACTPGMTQAACQAAGGTWKGAGTTCATNPCVETPPPPGSGSGSGSESGGLACGSICEVVYGCENGTILEVHTTAGLTAQECHQSWITARNAWAAPPVPNGSSCDTPTPPTVSYRTPEGCDQCGLRASFEGQRGVHEFLIDLKDKSGLLGVWFNAESVPDRFSLHWPLTAGNLPQASLPEYTSGWRGKVDGGGSEAAINALSSSSPYLRYPKSHGPISGSNGPRSVIAREVLGDARQNENWGYFTFYRSPEQAAAGQARYARLVVEAPVEDTKWYCGLICEVPLSQPICWEKVGPVSRFPVPAGQAPPFWVSGCDVGTVANPFTLTGTGWAAPTGPVRTGDGSPGAPYVYFGVTWSPGAHDWKAGIDTNVDDDPVYGTLAAKMRDEIVESLYHPITGFWVHTKQRLCGTSAAGNPNAEPTSSLGCHVSGFDYSSGSQATALDPGGALGTTDVGAGEATGGTEPPRGPGGVG